MVSSMTPIIKYSAWQRPFYSLDLEKRQHAIASGETPLVTAGPNTDTELRPMVGAWSDKDK